jgi:hypothetical protein
VCVNYLVRQFRFGNVVGDLSGSVARSKPEPFLYETQKRVGTPASFNRARTKHSCRAEGSATRQDVRLALKSVAEAKAAQWEFQPVTRESYS